VIHVPLTRFAPHPLCKGSNRTCCSPLPQGERKQRGLHYPSEAYAELVACVCRDCRSVYSEVTFAVNRSSMPGCESGGGLEGQ
jgi:hypothetical protein